MERLEEEGEEGVYNWNRWRFVRRCLLAYFFTWRRISFTSTSLYSVPSLYSSIENDDYD